MRMRPGRGGRGRGGARRAGASVRGALRSPGKPLESEPRAFFERRFGVDFGRVRIHTGPEAEDAARSVDARAFAVGRDVVFGAGQYEPRGGEGKRLLAHELAHVVQQGFRPAPAGPLEVAPGSHPLEAAAERAAPAVLAGVPGAASGLAAGSPAPPRLHRAEFRSGGLKVQVDYGDVVKVPFGGEAAAVEARYAAWTGSPADPIQADLAALSPAAQRWVLFALDLLADNPAPGLGRKRAVQRLIAHAPAARFRPLGDPAQQGYWDFENEALMVAGWFETQITASLKPVKGLARSEVRSTLSTAAGGGGTATCPSPRPASAALKVSKLETELPPKLEAYLKAIAPPATTRAQPMPALLPIADLVQEEALRFFAPYAGHARGRGNVFLQKWQYSAHVVSSTSPAAAPNQDARLSFLDSRARNKVGDKGLFAAVSYDSSCAADEAVLDAIIRKMEADPAISALVDRILAQKSYTAQDDDPKQVVLNVQWDPARPKATECKARWEIVNRMCHELVHVMVHDDFRAAVKGRMTMKEGFTEVLGDQLYHDIADRAGKDPRFRAKFEGGVKGPCGSIPRSPLEYDQAGKDADYILFLVKDDRFRAAYFMGRVDLLGIQKKRADGAADSDPWEREADRIAAEVAPGPGGPPRRNRGGGRRLTPHPPTALPPREGGGRPLEPTLRAMLEPRFGHDFSRVRVHHESFPPGATLRAFAAGPDVVLSSGAPPVHTPEGVRLLAHELAHVAQQGAAPPLAPVRPTTPEPAP